VATCNGLPLPTFREIKDALGDALAIGDRLVHHSRHALHDLQQALAPPKRPLGLSGSSHPPASGAQLSAQRPASNESKEPFGPAPPRSESEAAEMLEVDEGRAEQVVFDNPTNTIRAHRKITAAGPLAQRADPAARPRAESSPHHAALPRQRGTRDGAGHAWRSQIGLAAGLAKLFKSRALHGRRVRRRRARHIPLGRAGPPRGPRRCCAVSLCRCFVAALPATCVRCVRLTGRGGGARAGHSRGSGRNCFGPTRGARYGGLAQHAACGRPSLCFSPRRTPELGRDARRQLLGGVRGAGERREPSA
jgi:hypothetical protein